MKRTVQFLSVLFFLVSLATVPAGAQTYCTPPVYSPNYTGIIKVELNSSPAINTSSTINDLYRYKPADVASLKRGSSYTIQVTTRDEIMGIGFSDNLTTRVWIDWNGDKRFNDTTEKVGSWDDHVPGAVSVTFTVPDDANIGMIRMRVYTDMPEVDGHDLPTPCGYLGSSNTVGHHGEVEDYNMNINHALGIEQAAAGAGFSADVYPNPSSGSFKVDFSLSKTTDVKLSLYDLQGRELILLADERMGQGKHSLEIAPEGLGGGIYYLRFQTQEFNCLKKIVISK
jgi:hypothetical protein